MPEPTGLRSREFLPSANQALAELEEATGKPVLIVDAPELNVLATIRRAGPEDSNLMLRFKGGSNRVADYLIVFQCRMALREGQGPRAVLRDKPAVRDQVISERVRRAAQPATAGHGPGAGGVHLRRLILQLRFDPFGAANFSQRA